MRDFLTVAKALADENRLRALLALRGRELCVCQMIELLQLAPSTVSKHMSILGQARLVESRKNGRWVYYRLAEQDSTNAAAAALAWVRESLAADPQVQEDAARLGKILRLKRETLCKRQTRS
ncbi:MAG: metalloregulator ArsR/SmtB family transcription factor [Planctomycetia bacterium]|nr:metalloregulator ArsR/SmtB family transcription factor [Planctomycetia bacterium]